MKKMEDKIDSMREELVAMRKEISDIKEEVFFNNELESDDVSDSNRTLAIVASLTIATLSLFSLYYYLFSIQADKGVGL